MGSGVSRPTAASTARDAVPLESWTANDVADVLEPLGCAQFEAAVRGTGFNGAAVKAALVLALDGVQQEWVDEQATKDRERKARRVTEEARQRELASAQREATARGGAGSPGRVGDAPEDQELIGSLEDLAKTKDMLSSTFVPCQVSPPRQSQSNVAAQRFFDGDED